MKYVRVVLSVVALMTAILLCSCYQRGGGFSYAPTSHDRDAFARPEDAPYAPGAEAEADPDAATRPVPNRAPAERQEPVPPPVPGPTAGGPDNRDLGAGADQEPLGTHRAARQIDPEGAAAGDDPRSGESYARLHDNPFIRANSPGGDASTFGLDVDSASYANTRRYLTELGRLPPVDAVRIEELVNTLGYDYPAPGAHDPVPFRSDTAIAACPWAPEHLLVRLALRARTYDNDTRPPLNLVFLIDTSGSMDEPDKLPLVRKSLSLLTDRLDERDHVAIVTYAGTTDIRLPWTSGADHRAIRRAIRSLEANGSTYGSGGIVAAYAEAAKGVAPGTVTRVMLCTDGDFNVGVTDHDGLLHLIEQERGTGVFLNVYGYGMGNLKDDTLELLADHGNGCYGYIDSEAEADRLFDREAMGQLVTVAKDAKVQVFFNPAAVASWRLIGYEKRVLHREDFNDDRVDAGDIGAGHTVTALYEVVPAAGLAPRPMPAAPDDNPFIAHAVRDDDDRPAPAPTAFAPADANLLLRMRLRWKEPAASSSCLQEYDVPAVVGAMDADFKTAAAAAGFGMLLRCSPWRGSCTWNLVERLAADGEDGGSSDQRHEFVLLVERADELAHR
jgi:secreted protein with Ig-like and vWFA domain